MSREVGGPPGQWLRQRREAAGLSQEELASRSGLSVRTIGSLERGSTRTPHPRTIRLLGETLGLPGRACDELITAYRAVARDGPAAASPDPGGGRPAGTTGSVVPRELPGPVVPRELPGLVRHFVGREAELAALDAVALEAGALDAVAAGAAAAAGAGAGAGAAVAVAVAEQAGGMAPGPVVISAIGGTAGVGKTALALRWAHQVAGRFPDGQLYVNLRGYGPGEPMTAGEALAGFLRALGVPGPDIPAETEQRAARYRGMLSDRRMLIILDNAREAGQVRPLLPAAPACVTLVTSRDTLAGLVARDGAQRVDLDLLPMADAVGLLRALIGGRVDADPGAAAVLAAQCSRLPLALRVAAEIAARYPARALADLAGELEDQQHRLDMLDAGRDEDTAVRAVFSWSYRHLDAFAARAFRLAGLHQGPDLDRDAMAALAGTTAARAGRLLDVLARGHLIEPTGPGRYAMHDLLRGYARELAGRHDGEQERHQALTRLFDYYLDSAAKAMVAPGSTRQRPKAVAWLDAERPCLLAAAEYMAGNGWPSHASRLAGVLLRYLDAGGYFAEAVTLHSHARHAAREIADRAAEARALIGLGIAGIRQGRYQDATGHFRHAMTLSGQSGDGTGVAQALCALGIIDRLQGRYPEAIGRLERALDLCRANGDSAGAVLPLGNLGIVALRQGRYPQAADHLRHAVDLARQAGNLDEMADMLSELGSVALHQGLLRRAASLHRRARAVFRKTGNRTGETHTLNGLGEVFLAIGRPADARAEFAAALGLAARLGLRNQQARAHRGLGHAWQALGEAGEARRHWHEALAIFTDLDVPVNHVPVHLIGQRPSQPSPPPRPSRPPRPGQEIASELASENAWSGAGERH